MALCRNYSAMANLSGRGLEHFEPPSYIYIYIYLSRGPPKGSLFNSYYSEVYGRVLFNS